MSQNPSSDSQIPSTVLSKMLADKALLKTEARNDAERRRRKTQGIVDEMVKAAPDGPKDAAGRTEAAAARKDAVSALAAAVYKTVDEIAVQADLKAAPVQAPADIADIRIDDLHANFGNRLLLPGWLRRRIEIVYAKTNWINRNGEPGFFNRAVHQKHIPLDKALCILAHIIDAHDGTGKSVRGWLDAVIECGLFSRIKRGKYVYQRRCQDGEHCDLCIFYNLSDGLETLFDSYGPEAFNRGGTYFALNVTPRLHGAEAIAVGRTITPADWDYENPNSIVYREARHDRAFRYPDMPGQDELLDWDLESQIRGFLGAAQFVLGKLVKNFWLDGIRAKVENSVQFLPYASHQHWHGVGSSKCERDPQKMAEFIKEEVDAILARTCPGVYADVIVAVIPSADDLHRWIKYMNKMVNLVMAVDSVYNRYPDLGHNPCLHAKFLKELGLYPQRSKRVYGMIRHSIDDEHGRHTYMLRRSFVAGNHKFRKGTVLTEPKRHRLWREAHAARTAAKRKAALEHQEDRVLELLERRSERPWPKNATTALDVQRAHIVYKLTKAQGLLTRMKRKGKLNSKKCRLGPSGDPMLCYTRAASTKCARSTRFAASG